MNAMAPRWCGNVSTIDSANEKDTVAARRKVTSKRSVYKEICPRKTDFSRREHSDVETWGMVLDPAYRSDRTDREPDIGCKTP